MTAVAKELIAALGGDKVLSPSVRSEFDLAAAAEAGLPAQVAGRVLDQELLTAEELYTLVIPRRTLERRYERKQPLTVTESDRLLRVVRAVVRAIDALNSVEKAQRWLRTPNRAFRGKKPITLLETDIGARMVERALGRIEHGVHS
jgi:putative toxin-antitoxin system antitoxin component (TIGR02293 family)